MPNQIAERSTPSQRRLVKGNRIGSQVVVTRLGPVGQQGPGVGGSSPGVFGEPLVIFVWLGTPLPFRCSCGTCPGLLEALGSMQLLAARTIRHAIACVGPSRVVLLVLPACMHHTPGTAQ